MNSCIIRFPGYDARAERGAIRWELFLDWNVREVLATERADTLRILFKGAPTPEAWSRLLVDAEFPPPSVGAPERDGATEPAAA